ncbi:MAG: translation initiation factor IF-2 [Peptoniphilaceae bacterium]|nr:translation initiation factor IF-2 [Peptoniphilaceae bacterium]MDY6019066.1 translation initiation factor IF-2 [Anaerococcus sp.]
MAKKVRIYELAKEYNMPAKEMVTKLKDEFGLDIKSHMSVLSGEDLELVASYFKEDNKKEKKAQDKKDNKKKNNKAFNNFKDEEDDSPSQKQRKKKKNRKAKKNKGKKTTKLDNHSEAKKDGVIFIPETTSVKAFADKIGENSNMVIGKLIQLGVMAGLNDQISFDQAELIALEFDKEITLEEKIDEAQMQAKDLDYEDKEEDLIVRPPVVSVMGHVDHGKTSILDAIRNTNVTSGEAGGITQHIGASTVEINGKTIVFLDTPGHEAFTQMRMRGAQSTDIAILVVAADDGVMPQTVEAINHAKAAGIPILVAINKMDKEGADPNKVKQELMQYKLVAEEWGGDTIMVEVSAHTGQGIEELLEMVLLIAEMQELKANPNRAAVGLIIEAQLDKSRGPIATVLVQKGTLHASDYVVTGSTSGRIRAMFNSKGEPIDKVTPSMPAQILGLSDVAEAGDKIYVVDDEKTAREYADRAREQKREERLIQQSNTNLESMYSDIQEGDLKELNIIVKTDVKGTVDAVSSSFIELSNEEVKVNVIAGSVGGITESDVLLAQASNAIIIGFNVRPTQGALQMAEENKIEIRTYSVIYEAIEDVEKALKGMLDPEFKEKVWGRARVQQTFKVPGAGTIAGVLVTNGSIPKKANIRLLRDNVVIFDGPIASMKRFKDDAKELNNGYEGGIGLERFNDIKEGDDMEAYEMIEVERD